MTIEIDIDKLTELLVDAREYTNDGETRHAIRSLDKIGEMFGLDLEKISAEIDAQYDAWLEAQAATRALAERNTVNH